MAILVVDSVPVFSVTAVHSVLGVSLSMRIMVCQGYQHGEFCAQSSHSPGVLVLILP